MTDSMPNSDHPEEPNDPYNLVTRLIQQFQTDAVNQHVEGKKSEVTETLPVYRGVSTWAQQEGVPIDRPRNPLQQISENIGDKKDLTWEQFLSEKLTDNPLELYSWKAQCIFRQEEALRRVLYSVGLPESRTKEQEIDYFELKRFRDFLKDVANQAHLDETTYKIAYKDRRFNLNLPGADNFELAEYYFKRLTQKNLDPLENAIVKNYQSIAQKLRTRA